MIYFLLSLLLLSIILEGTVTALPLVFVCFVCLTILLRSPVIFIIAFLAGILLDALALRVIGGTSIFFLVATFLILLYQRKYEINTYPFVLIASLVGSVLFLLIFNYHNIIWDALLATVFGMLLFTVLNIKTKNENRKMTM